MSNIIKNNKGFTIIELIVVISAIAVLASIVLVNVTKYINKGKDNGIKTEMNQIMTAGFIYYELYNNYSTFCDAPEIQPYKQKIRDFSGLPTACDNGADKWKFCCQQALATWAACTELIEDNSKAWCVDYKGTREEIDNAKCKNNMDVCS